MNREGAKDAKEERREKLFWEETRGLFAENGLLSIGEDRKANIYFLFRISSFAFFS